jgi:hypothetical protein
MKPKATEDHSGMNASNAYQKLRSSQEFRRVYESGQRFYTPYFSAFILRTEGCQKRIGITVTRDAIAMESRIRMPAISGAIAPANKV